MSPTTCTCAPTPAPPTPCDACEQSCHAAVSAKVGNTQWTFINGEVSHNGTDLLAVDGAAESARPQAWVGAVDAWTYVYDGSTYAGTSYMYSLAADMSYPSSGTYCYNDEDVLQSSTDCSTGTQVSKITFSVVVEAYTVSVTTSGVTVTYPQPKIETVLTYFLVRSPDNVVFRVLGGASDGGLTSGNYLTRVKILTTEESSYSGLCSSSTAAADVSWTSNQFSSSNGYANVLSANGWDSVTGEVLSIGTDYSAAACFGEGSTTSVTDTQVCINNGVTIDEAKATCVGAMLGNGTFFSTNQMLQSCIRDWCSFGGAGKIAESYITEYRMGLDIDSLYLVTEYTVPTVTAIEVVQSFTITEVATSNGTALTPDEIMSSAYQYLRDMYEKGFGQSIGIVLNVAGTMIYMNGCTVESVWNWISYGRRSTTGLTSEFTATAPVGTEMNTAGASAASLAAGVTQVKQSDATKYGAFGSLAASSIISVSATTVQTVTLTGGTQAPTTSPGNADSELDTMLIIVGVVGLVVIVAVVVFVVVQISLKGGKSAPAQEASFTQVGLKQIPPAEPVTKAAEPVVAAKPAVNEQL